ncbi:MAG: PAS domain-containing protein, partial [Desulfobulbales bacterium]
MTVGWGPVITVDITGSLLTLIVAVICARLAWDWIKQKPEDIFRDYIFLLTLSFVFFAVSRSFGHLVKQFLLFYGLSDVWQNIAPFSGAINSTAFIVIFAFGIYFQRFQRVHLELRDYKNNLEEVVDCRTAELREANYWLEKENKQRRQAEEELRQTNTTMNNIFNSASPICITAIDYTLVETNDAYRHIWPSTVEGGKLIKCYESRPGSLCHTPDCPMAQILQGREEVVCETVREKDGETDRVFLQTTKAFRDADGQLVGTVTSFQEITERKRAQEELASERERLAVTLRSIGDGVITTDVEGRVVMLNKVAEQLCGWEQRDAQGRPLAEVFNIINEKTGKPCENPSEKVLASGNIVSLANHTALISRDGTQRSIADSGAPICDPASKVIGVVIVFRDVTEQ